MYLIALSSLLRKVHNVPDVVNHGAHSRAGTGTSARGPVCRNSGTRIRGITKLIATILTAINGRSAFGSILINVVALEVQVYSTVCEADLHQVGMYSRETPMPYLGTSLISSKDGVSNRHV